MDRGAWSAVVHRVTKSHTRLSPGMVIIIEEVKSSSLKSFLQRQIPSKQHTKPPPDAQPWEELVTVRSIPLFIYITETIITRTPS